MRRVAVFLVLSLVASLVAVGGFLGRPRAAYAAGVDCVLSGSTITCRIDQPAVTAPVADYSRIRFEAGDVVTLHADGCVQTGGLGATWKRYVNPSGANSDRLYHGLVGFQADSGTNQLPLQRFLGVNDRSFTVDRPAHLQLGYEDDEYDDNGYDDHDDGTDGQCSGSSDWGYGGPAFVLVTIVKKSPPPPPPCPSRRPFDLLPQGFGPTGEDRQPQFRWQCDWPGANDADSFPSAMDACNGFHFNTFGDPGSGLDLGREPCSTEIEGIDYPSKEAFPLASVLSGGIPTNPYWYACHFDLQVPDSSLAGHANWRPVTYSGPIEFQDHKDLLHGGDDDYNFLLDTLPDAAAPQPGATLTPPGMTHGNARIKLEFQARETIDRFTQPWWTGLHQRVDDDQSPGDLVNGHEAVVLGLFGLDVRHGADPEVHPVYALAIREAAPDQVDPANDKWAVFVRNWGTEGGCSQFNQQMFTPNITLHLPAPAMHDGTSGFAFDGLVSSDLRTRDNAPMSQPRLGPSGAGAVDLTFTTSAPDQQPLADGELTVRWKPAGPAAAAAQHAARPAAKPAAHSAPASRPKAAPADGQDGQEPEDVLGQLVDAMSPQQRQAYVAGIPAKTPPPTDNLQLGDPTVEAGPPDQQDPPRVVPVLDAASEQLTAQNRALAVGLCGAYGGAPPAPVDRLCADLKSEVYAVPNHYWRGDGDATDSIGGVDGTLQGATTFGPGQAGQGFAFGSQGDAVTFGPDVGNFGTDDFTVDFWLQTTSIADPIITKDDFVNPGWSISVGDRGTLFYGFDGSDDPSLAGRTVVNDGRLHHVTFTRTRTTLTATVDGNDDGSMQTQSVVDLDNTAELTIAGDQTNGEWPSFHGIVDEVKLFDFPFVFPGGAGSAARTHGAR